jgi:hypothetical protein
MGSRIQEAGYRINQKTRLPVQGSRFPVSPFQLFGKKYNIVLDPSLKKFPADFEPEILISKRGT